MDSIRLTNHLPNNHTLLVLPCFRHWDVPTGYCLHTMKGHTATVNAVVITGDGCKAVSGASDMAIKVWNTDTASR